MTNPVFCALDSADLSKATALAKEILPFVGGLKLGLEFFSANGPRGVEAIAGLGMPVFLDLKLHDIPNTVAGAIRSIAPLGPKMTTLHALGGADMIKAAVDAAQSEADRLGKKAPKLLAVTMLTSTAESELGAIGVSSSMVDQVLRLAALAQKAGADGVVASSHEITALRAECGPDFLIVTPGIRPAWAEAQDQKRVLTPKEALALGADHLVIGRPITGAKAPADAAKRILEEIR